jgi:hypothetical protein
VSIEDRVRAATRARTALVTGIRPLELPDKRRGRARRPRLTRRWNGWLIPLAAAAAIVAVAATLVAVRQAGGPHSAPVPPVGYTTVPRSYYTTVPRYYAAITGPQDDSGVTVGDDRTGKQVATVAPPAGESFIGVTGAADDRTFALTAQVGPQSPTASANLYVWYLLRIAPGTAHPYQLTRLPIKPLPAAFPAAALSPDGQDLAVLSSSKNGAGSGAATDLGTGTTMIQLYSVSSGALLRTWTVNENVWATSGGGLPFASFSWLADGRHLAFDGGAAKPGARTVGVRLLDVTAPSGELLASSRVIFTLPQSARCGALSLTPDGGTVICGTEYGGHADCAQGPAFVAYSVQTGKPVRVLYRDQQACDGNWVAVPLWAALSAEHVIGLLGHQVTNSTVEVGLAAGGRFTKLPGLQSPDLLPGVQPPDLYTAAF